MPNYPAPKVTKIEFLDGMKINFYFEGKNKLIDCADSDLAQRFPLLKQDGFFKKAVIDGGPISWGDIHVDLDEIIYEWT